MFTKHNGVFFCLGSFKCLTVDVTYKLIEHRNAESLFAVYAFGFVYFDMVYKCEHCISIKSLGDE